MCCVVALVLVLVCHCHPVLLRIFFDMDQKSTTNNVTIDRQVFVCVCVSDQRANLRQTKFVETTAIVSICAHAPIN